MAVRRQTDGARQAVRLCGGVETTVCRKRRRVWFVGEARGRKTELVICGSQLGRGIDYRLASLEPWSGALWAGLKYARLSILVSEFRAELARKWAGPFLCPSGLQVCCLLQNGLPSLRLANAEHRRQVLTSEILFWFSIRPGNTQCLSFPR
ncbi:hypothetical protein BRADI_2g56815v3 [Brachypodium distachyon]|uniref:Uncharacterized protein n=1 Tax=Brachypodium distachyon TaxID=15368 RepID=A0A2K2DG95_BRADI|nr:hypothetical protein BRADI_2g56815v3 [Brachypodium distachyon]